MGREVKTIDSVSAMTVSNAITAATKTASGSGYVANEVITLTGGSGTGATIKVLTVSAGAIATFSVLAGGTGYAVGDALTQASTTGSGTGATFTVATVKIYVSEKIELSNPAGVFVTLNKLAGSGTFYVVGGDTYATSAPCGLGDYDNPLSASASAGLSLPAAPAGLFLVVLTGSALTLLLTAA
jgi:hypothetical protein